VTFESSFFELQSHLQNFNPDIVLSFGLAGKRESIEFERVAINCMDAYIPDNQGIKPKDQAIDLYGDAAYFSTLPIRQFEADLLKAGIPAKISNSAGTYVCNYVFYKLAQTFQGTNTKFGFIHVPPLPEQKELVNMKFEVLLKALEIILMSLSSQGSLSVE
jgi:pyroglutamyl-peptidase